MPVHDWTRVEPGICHAFHTAWVGKVQKSLNSGLLPPGYYVLAEQHAGQYIADVLTPHVTVPRPELPPLPEMPLFLHPDRYINVPLEPTYEAAYGGMPAFWRDLLESHSPPCP